MVRIAAPLDADNVEKALGAFDAIDEIALVAVPGATERAMQEKILSHCQQEHRQDRFAILDGVQVQTPTALTHGGHQWGPGANIYGALYFPWILVRDPATKTDIAVPPSRHLAGVYARTDATRGVHKTPANTVIRGALAVQRLVSREEQAGVNLDGINIIRTFDGNVTVWGARTLGGNANNEWTYINVRRLFCTCASPSSRARSGWCSSPTSRALWAKITRNITAFLTNVWRDGALFGRYSTGGVLRQVRCRDQSPRAA